MAVRVLIFAGAPESHALDWRSSGLLADFEDSIAPFAGVKKAVSLTSLNPTTAAAAAAAAAPSASEAEAEAEPAGVETETETEASSLAVPKHAMWRSLPLEQARYRTDTAMTAATASATFVVPDQMETAHLSWDVSQLTSEPTGGGRGLDGLEPQFFTTTCLSLAAVDLPERGGGGPVPNQAAAHQEEVISQFYEHSMAIHELNEQRLASSQFSITGGSFADSQTAPTSSFTHANDTTSFLGADGSGNGAEAMPVREPLSFRGSSHLSDLKDIPSAAYLVKILPQTMSCNLIVGIISISQPRMVKTRWGSIKYLVEVLVGDETRAGFAITFWLTSDTVAQSLLAGLRPLDVVLLQNVALNVFTNQVYGSSLRKDLTKAHLLYRAKLDSQDVQGHYGPSDLTSGKPAHLQLDKTRLVRDWVLRFVGDSRNHQTVDGGSNNTSASKASKTGPTRPRWHLPPLDDTQ
ncbi:hypothetical protein B0T24DRAFT_85414 [Lasiosphaeria ovina]|uniref:Nucleic acid-binding, OB-fold protein n=1 Tax=Lasiosphaeria ovina TaxID=92902 RepID=A0AAE0NN05_9PEZI|nr:hypothetical protein B0T24DRAFT_85414 [Lasiosphaeria ovina]